MNCTCEKCGKSMDEIQFYTYKDGSKVEQCKKCLTMFVDNFEPKSFLWILEKMDVPYIPEEWVVLRDRAYAKNPEKVTGSSVMGRYLSKMKLNQWNKYGWADTEKIAEEHAARVAFMERDREKSDEEIKAKYAAGEINEYQYKTLLGGEALHAEQLSSMVANPVIGPNNMFNEEQYIDQSELDSTIEDLSKEDKLYLALKWGRLYKVSEWVELEKNYKKMSEDFGVEDSDSENALILICKTTLKANQALDAGDIDGFQKLSKVLDTLRKSANLTKAQNKEKDGKIFDSICEIVNLCERAENGGFIPRHEIKVDLDIADRDLRDMKSFSKSLVQEDPLVFRMIEEFIKKREILAEMEKDQAEAEEDEDGIKTVVLSDKDLADFSDNINKQKEIDDGGFDE